jgi:hypothetical protein
MVRDSSSEPDLSRTGSLLQKNSMNSEVYAVFLKRGSGVFDTAL